MNKLTVFIVEETAQGPALRFGMVKHYESKFPGGYSNAPTETLAVEIGDAFFQGQHAESLQGLEAALVKFALDEKQRSPVGGVAREAVVPTPPGYATALPVSTTSALPVTTAGKAGRTAAMPLVWKP